MTASEYAHLRGRSRAWVTGQLKVGMPAVRTGRQGAEVEIDPGPAIDWEIEQARAGRRGASDSQRDRLAKEQADKVAMANAVEREDHMLRSHIEPVLMEMAAHLGARLDSIAGRLANQVATLSDPADIRIRLLTEHRAVRSAVAEHLRKLARSRPVAEQRRGHFDAAAEPKSKPVGRRKSGDAAGKPKARKVRK